MIREIQVPEIAENVTEGTVIGLLVGKGDRIAADQNILEMETDKASVEIPAPFGGQVEEILVAEGDEVSVGQTVMKVETDETDETDQTDEGEEADEGEEDRDEAAGESEADSGEDSSSEEAGEPDRGKSRAAGKRDATAREEQEERKESAERDEPASRRGAAERGRAGASGVPASPATRRLAREIGVDITRVEGSGPGGRVSSDDVKAHARDEGRGAEERREASGGGPSGKGGEARQEAGGERREAMTRVRKLTAERTAESWATIPHVTQHGEADLTRVNEYVDRMAARVERAGGKLTVTAILVKLVAQALRVFPRFNASADMEAGELVFHDRVAIGIAADTDRGLLVPVVRDPDTKGIVDLAVEIGELAAKARSGDLEPSEMQGATFAISNLGGIGGTSFTPVIVPPAVAILGVARARTQPVYNGRSFEPREILPMSLSYDHRVIDGADGARFVVWLQTAMEDPFAAMMEGGR